MTNTYTIAKGITLRRPHTKTGLTPGKTAGTWIRQRRHCVINMVLHLCNKIMYLCPDVLIASMYLLVSFKVYAFQKRFTILNDISPFNLLP